MEVLRLVTVIVGGMKEGQQAGLWSRRYLKERLGGSKLRSSLNPDTIHGEGSSADIWGLKLR